MNEIRSNVIKFGNNIDTDVILSGHRLVHGGNIEFLAQFAMENIDENFVEKVKSGQEIIVAGKNFGCGSSRQQAPEVLKEAGIKAIVAESFARIFFRNAINIGLPVFIAPGIYEKTKNNNEILIDITSGIIKDRTNGIEISTNPVPTFLQEIITEGGLIPHLQKKLGIRSDNLQ